MSCSTTRRQAWRHELIETAARHQITRIRRDPRRRRVMVASVERLGQHMLRLRFTSPDLADFESAAPDDHVKLFIPNGTETVSRDYTPRAFDTSAGTLAIDFALHDAGPATCWALAAKAGDTVEIGGPRGSVVVPDDFDWFLLIGDETALPSIACRLEELRAGVPVIVIVAVDGEEDRLALPERADCTLVWSLRAGSTDDDTDRLRAVIARLGLPAGEGFVWIAAEGTVARRLRAYVVDELGHPRAWTKASGYWVKDSAGAHEKIRD